MGRLRNLSQSLFNKQSGHGSPSTVNNTPTSPADDFSNTKAVPALARETSSTSVVDTYSGPRTGRSNSRPVSHVYNPPTMSSSKEDNIEELKPAFGFLSSHQNKLYQEGYFLKLTDLDINGKPNTDRSWTECFAQLVGTVLSLWDAAALDAAGQDGEVAPSFINLADASIKMVRFTHEDMAHVLTRSQIETLPTRNQNIQPLQNVLSVSTAGKNRYLFHFNSLHSLTQWTAGIRLAMFEHASLQELYTGSLIAGKGKLLNNIKTILERLRFVEEDWARVRFGAGTPWRRCWYVIEPPDEKEWQKAQKLSRKRGAYERPQYPHGDIKFYDTKKSKKTKPIATISDVYSAYAVYPQSKPLIDQSTLVKLEGKITIHSQPESQTEGFVFIMPELHPAVSGFEMMLRFLFPAFDTFGLYGRPSRLIADTLDSRGLMFAMPKDRRYGYLDIIDVAGLIHTEGSDKWTEREWRKRMKELVSRRMTMATQGRVSNVENGGRRSLGSRPGGVRYGDSDLTLPNSLANQSAEVVYETPNKVYQAPAASSIPSHLHHTRSASESVTTMSQPNQRKYVPSRLSTEQGPYQAAYSPQISPIRDAPAYPQQYRNGVARENEIMTSSNSSNSDLEQRAATEQVTHDLLPEPTPPAPVNQPFFQHQPSDRPQRRPMDRPDLRREKSRMSNATLDQLMDANRKGSDAGAAASAAWKTNGRYDGQDRGVIMSKIPIEAEIDANPFPKAIITGPLSETLTQASSTINPRFPISRTTTQQTVSRKPLPIQSKYATPTENSFVPMPDRDSSPDYASTTRSKEKPFGGKKLGGVRKTIGDPDYVVKKIDIPEFDFGVTQSLTPDPSRPGTAAGRVSPVEIRIPSTPQTPIENRKHNVERISPGRFSPLPSPQSRPSSRQMWQPGLASGRQSPGGLTAEEFVQQRAAFARLPGGYASRRSVSNTKAEEMMAPTAEKLQAKRPSPRTHSRPSSRGSLLDFSANLSAREQEHVARMSGSPLLNLSERCQTPDPNIGLIGAISAREQDKRNMKEGISNHLTQSAIAHRQQQAQMAYLNQIQAQYRPGANAWAQQQQTPYSPVSYYPQQAYSQQQQHQSQQQQLYPSGSQYYGGYFPPQGGYQHQ